MPHPLLFEINTRCWLRSLSEQSGRAVTLADIPGSEFDRWQNHGFTHIWLMGVWTTGPRSRAVSLAGPELQACFRQLLPKSGTEDFAGSPYAIAGYEVPAALGGEDALKRFRQQLNARGIKLILDFVANHAGLDHPWIFERPELFVQGPVPLPGTFSRDTIAGPRHFAHGRDPYFPPWRDTVQFDFRRSDTRAAMLDQLQSVARQCDGVRCDLAMLQLNAVFAKTWSAFPVAAAPPASEFWTDAIPAVKSAQPGFLFLAEAYWGLEARLQSLGFDYTYDKRVYDFLAERRGGELQKHLLESTPGFLSASAHFLENHDEPRIAAVLTPAEHRAVALLTLALPGMRMLYEGQLEGRRLRVPVQFARWPDELADAEIKSMYEALLSGLGNSAVGRGDWKLLPVQTEPGQSGGGNVIVIQWQDSPARFDLIAVNLASMPVRCRLRPEVRELAARDWHIREALGGAAARTSGGHLFENGLWIDLPAQGAQLLGFSRIS